MLRFTPSGAFRAPTSLQVRIGNVFDGRLRAGAPAPSRALTDAEAMDNVHHFTEGMRGPRTVPCDALVLSGTPTARIAGLGPVLERARAWGVRQVTLHVAPGALPVEVDADVVVMPVRAPSQPAVLAGWGGHRVAVVPLDRRTLRQLAPLVDALVQAPPDHVVLTWPFPPAGPPAPAHEVVAALDRVEASASPLAWTLKGLPACVAGRHGARGAASRNRWYVDADHQGEHALVFFPEVVRLHKEETCRFCARDGHCDGVAADWMRQGRLDRLRPLDDPAEG